MRRVLQDTSLSRATGADPEPSSNSVQTLRQGPAKAGPSSYLREVNPHRYEDVGICPNRDGPGRAAHIASGNTSLPSSRTSSGIPTWAARRSATYCDTEVPRCAARSLILSETIRSGRVSSSTRSPFRARGIWRPCHRRRYLIQRHAVTSGPLSPLSAQDEQDQFQPRGERFS